MTNIKTYTTALDVQKLHRAGAKISLEGIEKNGKLEKWQKPLSNLAKNYINKQNKNN